jgi:hypothetical protein
MERQEGDGRGVNPYVLGLLGLGLMLAGYAVMSHRSDDNAAPPPALRGAGQLVFWGGVVVVVFAAVTWYRQAQLPEPPRQPAAEEPDAGDAAEDHEPET